jgi:hypothetical protein
MCPTLTPTGTEGAQVATRILEFTEKFTHHVVGPVCQASYNDFFTEALDKVADACGEFVVPEG